MLKASLCIVYLFFAACDTSTCVQVDLKRHERENSLAQKEIVDLQKQVITLIYVVMMVSFACLSDSFCKT